MIVEYKIYPFIWIAMVQPAVMLNLTSVSEDEKLEVKGMPDDNFSSEVTSYKGKS